MNSDLEHECYYCGHYLHNKTLHLHTDGETYAINGFPENKEMNKAFEILSKKITGRSSV